MRNIITTPHVPFSPSKGFVSSNNQTQKDSICVGKTTEKLQDSLILEAGTRKYIEFTHDVLLNNINKWFYKWTDSSLSGFHVESGLQTIFVHSEAPVLLFNLSYTSLT